MHRGIVYAIVQVVFSITFSGSTMSVFNGYLLMLYPTIFTMAPVFALVLDEDNLESQIDLFPELYKDLLKSRAMNTRSFLQWVWLSFFQGGVMMYMTLELFSDDFFQIVSIAFTALLLTELVINAAIVHFRILWRQRRLHLALFVAAELMSLVMFFLAVEFLPDTFDQRFFWSWEFWSKILIVGAASIAPLVLFGFAGRYLDDRIVGRHY
jgi:phospholipid-translocating ATPase